LVFVFSFVFVLVFVFALGFSTTTTRLVFICSSRGLITRKNAATTPPTPSTSRIARMPSTSGNFDFFFGTPAAATGGAVCVGGNGALGRGGSAAVCVGGNGALGVGCGGKVAACCGGGSVALWAGGVDRGGALGVDGGGGCAGGIVAGGGCRFEAVGWPVGPVFFGSTTVGAEDGVAIVSLKSGGRLLTGFSGGGSTGSKRLADPWIVALGSNGWSPETNKPPSTVQNF
jgi:hypothetical protein